MTWTAATSPLALLLAGLLALTGLGKLTDRALAAQAARTALPRLVRGGARATRVLRAAAAAEVALAVGLLAAPALDAPAALAAAPGVGAALLGAGFLGYLGYARAVAPESSCGCTANDDTPVTWHSFARAGVVALGGAAVAAAALADGAPWWRAFGDHPAGFGALLVAGAVGLAYLSAGPDRRWLLPLRRLRLRLAGHPLASGAGAAAGSGGPVPVAASVELLERSLAWETAMPLVRSGLVEHWDEDGWRILHYTGAHRGEDGRERPVSVLFALDATADRDDARGHVVRVSVVDQESERVLTSAALQDRLPATAA
ncbi:MauE/DoxX family redox-associated membrane protein [Streptomyces sp. 4N509B]|uniref:MauE/DoxX family redox-associated membrane protein n=1 Tax=Streptomyces sp. 4N509B TaxID=3457413 RepID=UPI003FD68725